MYSPQAQIEADDAGNFSDYASAHETATQSITSSVIDYVHENGLLCVSLAV